MNTLTQEKETVASMNEVVMNKQELIESLIKNKAMHDEVFEMAVAGYWDAAKEELAKKRRTLEVAIDELKEDAAISFDRFDKKINERSVLPFSIETRGLAWNNGLGLVFPENHTKDYDRAIKMMQASIFDTVKLTEREFNSYVLNDWEWKNKFLSANTPYISGCLIKGLPYSVTGSLIGQDNTYNTARSEARNKASVDFAKNF